MTGKAVRETLAAFGVIASLVFVGWEIRQNTVAARSQTRQALADGVRDLNIARATNRDLARAWLIFRPDVTAGRDFGSFTPLDSVQARNLMVSMLRHVENVYLQVQEGVIDDSVLSGYGFTVPAFQSPAFKSLWRSLAPLYDEAFVSAFEEANNLAP